VLLEAAISRRVRHFLHLGSPSAIAGRRDPYASNESDTAGFLLKYLGHLVQGSEMGELTLIEGLIHRLPGLARS
jgi:hypothetical protein